ncbi:radical SAM protein [Sphingobium phenoxybenzoativorans]|uniref:radical SAM protein n=1 Tax=Sphingobium phenoxybenzoativorans TaxID=1592790 RepID=UPI001FEAE511|nr:radical SAM protein [Sphingobium phenoxybenzoativorans]
MDVAPSCQLSCPVCIHGSLSRDQKKSLPASMTIETFRTLVDQVKGHSHVMSLYNLGEPLMNRDLVEMIRYASAANINTYVTSNFSFSLSDERLRELATSGLTAILVAVDGISSETFGKHRIRGRWDLVDSNLRRFAALAGKSGPRLILQYICFDHNEHEWPKIESFCKEMGIDAPLVIDGATTPWVEDFQPRHTMPRKGGKLPLCGWPYFSALVSPDGLLFGCCHYRMEENYLALDRRRAMGDIRTSTVKNIYRSEPYRLARSLASKPTAPEQKGHFCESCPVLNDGPHLPRETFSPDN